MPRKFYNFLDGQNIYICRKCETHLASLNELISKAFRGQYGTAYLFNQIVNFEQGTTKDQHLTTGEHTITDIYCKKCNNSQPIGWRYLRAVEQDQKYKEGKYILEEACIKLLDIN